MKVGLQRVSCLLGLLCALAGGVRACSCGTIGTLEEHIQLYLKDREKRNTIVFLGTALNSTSLSGGKVTFRVKQLWKGTPQRYIMTTDQSTSCDYGFVRGQTYLIYDSENNGSISPHYCSPTKPLARAKADLALLGPPIYEPNPKPLLLAAIGATLALGAGFYWRRKPS